MLLILPLPLVIYVLHLSALLLHLTDFPLILFTKWTASIVGWWICPIMRESGWLCCADRLQDFVLYQYRPLFQITLRLNTAVTTYCSSKIQNWDKSQLSSATVPASGKVHSAINGWKTAATGIFYSYSMYILFIRIAKSIIPVNSCLNTNLLAASLTPWAITTP